MSEVTTSQIRKIMEGSAGLFNEAEWAVLHIMLQHIDSLEHRIKRLEAWKEIAQ